MSFDLDEMLTTPTDEMSTDYPTVPEGEYTARIDDLPEGKPSNWMRPPIRINNGPRTGTDMHIMRIPFILLDIEDSVLEAAGFMPGAKPRVNMDLILDMDDGKLQTGEGRNIKLGQLRDALDQNTPGWTFAALSGAGPVRVKVGTRSDRKNPEIKYTEISRVTKL